MVKPLHRPICHSYSGLSAEQDLTEAASANNGREADDTRGCAHAGSLRASITGYATLSLFSFCFSEFVAVFLLFVCCFLYNGTKMLARLSETVGNQFKIFYLILGYKMWPSGYS